MLAINQNQSNTPITIIDQMNIVQTKNGVINIKQTTLM